MRVSHRLRRPGRRGLSVIAVLLLAVAGTGTWLILRPGTSEAQAEPITYTVSRTTVTDTVSASGTLAAANQAEVAQQVSLRSQAAATARKLRRADLARLNKLKRREAAIQKQILAKAMHDKGGGYTGDTGGLLARPVSGWVTSPYGWRRHPIYGYWGLHDGTDFHAPCGEPMHAGAAGRVISEYYSSVWGNRLYLDVGRVNGKAMTLIYNHISSYRSHTGDQVGRGDVVAYAGTTGWSTGCHLHFTVLLDGNAVDPMQFF